MAFAIIEQLDSYNSVKYINRNSQGENYDNANDHLLQDNTCKIGTIPTGQCASHFTVYMQLHGDQEQRGRSYLEISLGFSFSFQFVVFSFSLSFMGLNECMAEIKRSQSPSR